MPSCVQGDAGQLHPRGADAHRPYARGQPAETFLEIGKGREDAFGAFKLRWPVIKHVVFVVSGVLMAAMVLRVAKAKALKH